MFTCRSKGADIRALQGRWIRGTLPAHPLAANLPIDGLIANVSTDRPSVRTLAYGYGHRRIFPTQLKTMGIDSRPLWTKLYPVFR